MRQQYHLGQLLRARYVVNDSCDGFICSNYSRVQVSHLRMLTLLSHLWSNTHHTHPPPHTHAHTLTTPVLSCRIAVVTRSHKPNWATSHRIFQSGQLPGGLHVCELPLLMKSHIALLLSAPSLGSFSSQCTCASSCHSPF